MHSADAGSGLTCVSPPPLPRGDDLRPRLYSLRLAGAQPVIPRICVITGRPATMDCPVRCYGFVFLLVMWQFSVRTALLPFSEQGWDEYQRCYPAYRRIMEAGIRFCVRIPILGGYLGLLWGIGWGVYGGWLAIVDAVKGRRRLCSVDAWTAAAELPRTSPCYAFTVFSQVFAAEFLRLNPAARLRGSSALSRPLPPALRRRSTGDAAGSVPSRPSKRCPSCAEDILLEARRCRFCGQDFPAEEVSRAVAEHRERLDADWREAACKAEASAGERRRRRQLRGRHAARLVSGLFLALSGVLCSFVALGMFCSEPVPGNTAGQQKVGAVVCGLLFGLLPLAGGMALLRAAGSARRSLLAMRGPPGSKAPPPKAPPPIASG